MTHHPLENSWCYIGFSQLQLDAWEYRENLHEHALAVVCEHRQVILQANSSARQYGIAPSMNVSDAWLLCDSLAYQFHQPELEHELLTIHVGYLYRHFADISIDPTEFGLWIKLHTQQHLYPDLAAVEQQLAAILHDFTYTAFFSSNPTLAKIGIDDRHVPLLEAVQKVCITRALLSPSLEHKLLRMGLNTIDKVLKIPLEVLGKKLGQEAVNLHLKLTGRTSLNLTFFHPETSFYGHRQLHAEITTWSGISYVVSSLLETLEGYLIEHQQATQQVSLILFQRDYPNNPAIPPHPDAAQQTTVDISMARPTCRASEVFHVVQLHMETRKFTQPVTDIALRVTQLEPLNSSNTGFWLAQHTDDGLDTVLNRLQAKLGSARIKRVIPQSGWLPERQQVLCDAGSMLTDTTELQRTWTPAWLLDAVPIELNQWQLQGQPQRFSVPWWLSQTNVSQTNIVYVRDYWLAQDAAGRCGWIYHEHSVDTESGHWFLQGWAS